MKKVLIISYFFPPCNLTASQRIKGWANYLSNYGYYPTIVTRNWDHPINSPEDVLISSGDKLIHEKNEQFEVYYLPYKASNRDLIFSKNKNNKLIQKTSKIWTLKDQILENYSNSAIPFSNIFDFSLDLIQKNDSFSCLIISGNPFIQFKFGYLLQKKTGIKWIADYRDDWSTSELKGTETGVKKVISLLQSKKEKKWLSSSECITSISKKYSEKIGAFVNKKGHVIVNGYDDLKDSEQVEVEQDFFTITYNGSLYPTQPIEHIIKAIKRIIESNESKLKIQLNFPGLGFDPLQRARVEKAIIGFENNVLITDRIPKSEVIKIQKGSDLLLMVSHTGIKGIPSSKMYEYIGLKKQILLFPNDHDIVEETLLDSGLGIICEDDKDIYSSILQLIKWKENGNSVVKQYDEKKIEFYSRSHQTAQLAKLLDQITR